MGLKYEAYWSFWTAWDLDSSKPLEIKEKLDGIQKEIDS